MLLPGHFPPLQRRFACGLFRVSGRTGGPWSGGA